MSITLTPLSPYSPYYSWDNYALSSDVYVPYNPQGSQTVVVTSDIYPVLPVASAYPYSYMGPYSVQYPNLNEDSRIRDRLTKYFYYKTLDKWLYDKLVGVLDLLSVNGSHVEIAKTPSKTTSQSDVDKKVKYIEEEVLSFKDMYKILSNLIVETRVNWYDLPKNEYLVRDAVKHWLKRELRD